MDCRQFTDDIPLSKEAIADIENTKKIFRKAKALMDEYQATDGEKTTKGYEAFKKAKNT